jgi:predicted metal-dependent enzyme (double-stranded beta helix superfamily)
MGVPPHDRLTVDGPVRELFSRIAPHADLAAPDLPRVADALIDLSRDLDYLTHAIERIGDASGQTALYKPDDGPRLTLVHRREGEMSPVHDHGVWVALAPVRGIETHRRFRRPRSDEPDPARLEVAAEEALRAATCVTLMPPDDIHDHGHVAGRGDAAYVLILLGGDQFTHRRTEWDLASGRHRTLEPGDRGRWLASMPLPS